MHFPHNSEEQGVRGPLLGVPDGQLVRRGDALSPELLLVDPHSVHGRRPAPASSQDGIPLCEFLIENEKLLPTYKILSIQNKRFIESFGRSVKL